MPKLLLIFLLLVLLVSCNSRKRELDPVFPPVRGKISIIDVIAQDGGVDGGVIGYDGGKSEQYKRYEWMKSKLSDSSLHQLTDHQSPAVRVYAFFALVERKYPLLKEIVNNHKNDSAVFMSNSGCTGNPDKVNCCFQRIIEGGNWFASLADYDLNFRKKLN